MLLVGFLAWVGGPRGVGFDLVVLDGLQMLMSLLRGMSRYRGELRVEEFQV